jgi:hypothetical protein
MVMHGSLFKVCGLKEPAMSVVTIMVLSTGVLVLLVGGGFAWVRRKMDRIYDGLE